MESKVPPTFIEVLQETIQQTVIPFSSARAAMFYGLRALQIGRNDEIFIPPFLSHCVTSAISRTGFLSMKPSDKTKVILVYHQYGFPQKLDKIQKIADERGWYILNNCVNTIFSTYKGQPVVDWGDFVSLSFPKLYPCNLGGGLIEHHKKVQKWIENEYPTISQRHHFRSYEAFESLKKARYDLSDFENLLDVEAVYGYLPELVAFPPQAFKSLPQNSEELSIDLRHRQQIWDLVRTRFPDLVPQADECEVVPFAIPLRLRVHFLETIQNQINEAFDVEVPILHFDFSRNLLNPDYKKSLVLGCHSGWSKSLVNSICDLIEKA
jgi:hypothetical protein